MIQEIRRGTLINMGAGTKTQGKSSNRRWNSISSSLIATGRARPRGLGGFEVCAMIASGMAAVDRPLWPQVEDLPDRQVSLMCIKLSDPEPAFEFAPLVAVILRRTTPGPRGGLTIRPHSRILWRLPAGEATDGIGPSGPGRRSSGIIRGGRERGQGTIDAGRSPPHRLVRRARAGGPGRPEPRARRCGLPRPPSAARSTWGRRGRASPPRPTRPPAPS